jgi:hypothetical protein
MFNLVNQQTSKMNKGERKEQKVLESEGKKKEQNYRNQQILLNNNPNVNGLNTTIKTFTMVN